MATLTNAELRGVYRHFMRAERAILRANGELAKTELEAIFLAARTFLDDHDQIYNGTVPNPPRGAATNSIKAAILGYVALGIADKAAGRPIREI